jgi:chitinase
MTIDRAVGNTIDFYNVQFYNQGNTEYNSYEKLFLKSGSYFSGTSVNELIQRGIPSNKIVVGKPVTQGDAANSGLVNH